MTPKQKYSQINDLGFVLPSSLCREPFFFLSRFFSFFSSVSFFSALSNELCSIWKSIEVRAFVLVLVFFFFHSNVLVHSFLSFSVTRKQRTKNRIEIMEWERETEKERYTFRNMSAHKSIQKRIHSAQERPEWAGGGDEERCIAQETERND